MKSILFGALVFFTAACSSIHSESVDAGSLGNVNNRTAFNQSSVSAAPSATPPSESNANLMMPIPTPQPKSSVERHIVNEADYTTAKFDYAKMRATTLSTQPLEIVKVTARADPDKWKRDGLDVDVDAEMRRIKKYPIKTADYDFNHDGVAERVILSRGEDGDEVESFDIYMQTDNRWHLIFSIGGNPDTPETARVAILTNRNKTGFDLIKTTIDNRPEDNSEAVNYHAMQEGQYQTVDCYWIEGKDKESIPCEPLVKYEQ